MNNRANLDYVRNDENNDPVVTQPGITTVSSGIVHSPEASETPTGGEI